MAAAKKTLTTGQGAGAPSRGSFFTRFSAFVSRQAGRPQAFVGAVAIVVVWAATGPFLGFSETWQLVINTGTTIITFLMVFVIQASQNRDTAALHLKIDELIRATAPAHNALLDIDNLDEKKLEEMRRRYGELARVASEESDILAALRAGPPARARRRAAQKT